MKILEKTICQSCGMPLIAISDFGTNNDGSPNGEYCHHCFQDGEFTDHGITLEEKIEKNIKLAKKLGIPEEQAINLAITVIPTLKRWQ